MRDSNKISPRQSRHIDFILQFTSDIRHISGKNNIVADTLSRIEVLEAAVNFDALAESQEKDEQLLSLLRDGSALQLKRIQVPGSREALFCDVSTTTARPYVTQAFRQAVFNSVHQLSHPGINASVKLITQRYVWPSMKKDIRTWARACIECQRAKVSRHVNSPLGTFITPSARFEHVHLDIVVMPLSEGFKYCLTCVDRYTRWPEAIPIPDQEATTVAKAFITNWIARFGCPVRITTDQGRQFESNLFRQLSRLIRSTHLRTTAYHPAANGMVERFHRQLKAAIKCHKSDHWTEVLPLVLLGIRSAWKDDLRATTAELVYGESLRLPSQFLCESSAFNDENPSPETLINKLKAHFKAIRPVMRKHHGVPKIFVFKELQTTSEVFLRHDGPKSLLQNPYDGPFRVVSRDSKTFVINVHGKDVRVSIDRLKPAYVFSDGIPEPPLDRQAPVKLPTTISTPESAKTSKNQSRSGRQVRFTEHYQGGFS